MENITLFENLVIWLVRNRRSVAIETGIVYGHKIYKQQEYTIIELTPTSVSITADHFYLETSSLDELIRVVKFQDEISLDLTGKKNGRGAYICNDKCCIEKLKKQKLLNRAFSCPVEDAVYDKIMEDFLGKQD